MKGLGELNSKASTWLRRVAAWMHGAAALMHRLQPRCRLSTFKDAKWEEGKDKRSEQLGVGVGKGLEGGERGGEGRPSHFLQ